MSGTIYRETILAWDPPTRWAYRVDETSAPVADALVEDWALSVEHYAGRKVTIVRWTFAISPSAAFRAAIFAAPLVMGALFRRAMQNLDRSLRAGVNDPQFTPRPDKAIEMERELLFSGIGGQGIQLGAKVLARAAMSDGLEVQLFGSYGGMMRGGNTETTLVVGDAPIVSPPTVQRAWAVVLMHSEYAAPTLDRVRDGGLVFTNADVVAEGLVAAHSRRAREVRIPATQVAIDTGDIVGATMVMIGALVAATGLVTVDSMCAAVAPSLPPYRQQLAELNERALRAGAAIAPTSLAPAWESEVVPR